MLQGSVGKRSRTDPVAARRRFDIYLVFCLSLLFNRLALFPLFAKCGMIFVSHTWYHFAVFSTCSEATAGGREVKKKQAPTPTRVSARSNKGAPIVGDTHSTRSSPRTSTFNTGDPVVLPDLRKTVKK